MAGIPCPLVLSGTLTMARTLSVLGRAMAAALLARTHRDKPRRYRLARRSSVAHHRHHIGQGTLMTLAMSQKPGTPRPQGGELSAEDVVQTCERTSSDIFYFYLLSLISYFPYPLGSQSFSIHSDRIQTVR